MKENSNSYRYIYLDILRVMAIVGVIALHITSDTVIKVDTINSFNWWTANVIYSVVRFCIPIFFMISGALILNEKIRSNSLRSIKYRVIKLGVPFIIWSIIYCYFKYFIIFYENPNFLEFIKVAGVDIISNKSYSHLWFVYVILAIYMIEPFIKKFLQHSTQREVRYLIILWFTTTILYKTIKTYLSYLYPEINLYVAFLDIPMVATHTGYFILGYYLHRYKIGEIKKASINVLAKLAIVFTPIFTYHFSKDQTVLDKNFYDPFALTTFIIAVGVFLWIQSYEWDKLEFKNKMIISAISNASLGVYFIHLIVQVWVVNNIGKQWEEIFIIKLLIGIFFTFIISFIIVKICSLHSGLGKLLGTYYGTRKVNNV